MSAGAVRAVATATTSSSLTRGISSPFRSSSSSSIAGIAFVRGSAVKASASATAPSSAKGKRGLSANLPPATAETVPITPNPASSPLAEDGRHEVWREGIYDHDNEPMVKRRDGTFAPIEKLRGFLSYQRNAEPYRKPLERLKDWEELNPTVDDEEMHSPVECISSILHAV